MSIDSHASTKRIGRLGEQFATEYVERTLGWTVVDRNWRCRGGELDLIAQAADFTIFIEVKTRQGLTAGHPLDAVNPSKQVRLRRLVNWYLAEHRPVQPADVRIDVIGLLMRDESVIRMWHVRDALA